MNDGPWSTKGEVDENGDRGERRPKARAYAKRKKKKEQKSSGAGGGRAAKNPTSIH